MPDIQNLTQNERVMMLVGFLNGLFAKGDEFAIVKRSEVAKLVEQMLTPKQ